MRCTSFYGRLLIAVALMSITTTSVSADWHEKWHGFWNRIGIGYERNNAWPDPFNEYDAMAVITPFEAMKQNGNCLFSVRCRACCHTCFFKGKGYDL